MDRKTLIIWGRQFNLDVVFDCYPGEEVTALQKETLSVFLNNPQILEEAKSDVERYCISKNNLKEIKNIFQFVVPQTIYVKRTKDNSKIIGILCTYRFDIEHGLAIVFKDNQLKKIGSQDIIL